MRRFLLFTIFVLVAAIGIVGWALHEQYAQTGTVPSLAVGTSPTSEVKSASTKATSQPTPTSTPAPTALPAEMKITVPYTMQAPFNKWDALHEDACEETSLIMMKHFLDGTPISTPAQADQEITDLVHWEQAHGYGPSITLQQLNQVAKDYYGLTNGRVVQISSIDQVKQELADGRPAILGMAGKLLPNPYFSNGGPNYHMLVAVGYDATGIMTNEPGTWRGNTFHYDYQPFYTAIHDWNPQNILNGQKALLVFGTS